MKTINECAVQMLEQAGVKIVEKVLDDKGGYVVVLDCVVCSSGSQIWREEKEMTLRYFEQVINYIEGIS